MIPILRHKEVSRAKGIALVGRRSLGGDSGGGLQVDIVE
jgi:hypothetical protein